VIWQDVVIAGVVTMFTATIIPLIRSGVPLPKWTTIPMTVGSLVLAGVYITMSLWLSLGIEVAQTFGWGYLCYGSFKR
jgi:hypothetical protein